MRLSKKDLTVLSTVELQADLPIDALCKAARLRSHSVRYSLHKLSEAEVIGQKRPILSNESLGYFFCTLFFSLSSRRQERKQELMSFLLNNPLVSWMFELGGDFQYGVSFKVRHVSEIRSFLDILSQKFGNIFFDKALSTQLAFLYFGRRYLSASAQPGKPISFSVDEKVKEVDELDSAILAGLAEGSYHSHSELAARLKIPVSTFERRRQNLESRGIIKGYFYWIDPAKLAVHSYIIMIYAHGISLDLRSGLRHFAEKEACVVYFTEAMGQWEFELGIEVPNDRQVTQITEKIYDLFADQIRTLKVVPILKYFKFKSFKV